jgi:uncharacterized RDD family membrane protein YckC
MRVYANDPPCAAPAPSRTIDGFWRRLLAFAIDAFLTALPCAILGFAFYTFFSVSTVYGLLIGFSFTLLYFAILGSSVARGQTLGHRITEIQVVNREGNFISLERSLLRYLILLGPLLLSSQALPSSAPYAVKTSVDWLISGAELAVVYLYLFNRSTQQSQHDVATETYVVEAHGVGSVESPRFWAGHWAILGGIAIVGVVLSIGFGNTVLESAPFPELTGIQQAILNSGKVQSAGASVQKTWRNGEVRTGLIVNVVWKSKPLIIEQDATKIADIVIRADSQAFSRDFITVNFRDGFVVGFATFSNSRQVSHDPATWIKQAENFGLR